jgi:hypothetical protein
MPIQFIGRTCKPKDKSKSAGREDGREPRTSTMTAGRIDLLMLDLEKFDLAVYERSQYTTAE